MKNIFTLIFTILTCSLFSQNLSLSQDSVFLKFGDKIDYGDFFINNGSSSDIEIDCTLKPICYDASDDTAIAICFGQLCFSPVNEEITFGELTQMPVTTISGGSQDNTFKFEPFIITGEHGSTWEVTFFDRNNPDDKATLIVFVDNCSLTNTEEAFETLGFNIFPNPVQAQLNLDFVSSISKKNLTIYNVLGKVVNTQNIGSGVSNFSIDISTLEKGNYFIQISDDNGLQYVEKFIKV